jgi:hypothetical protein
MPTLDRYEQQFSPSGRVGAIPFNPDAVVGSGDAIEAQGLQSLGSSIAGTSEVFQQIQDMEDSLALSSSRRQASLHMAETWNAIAQEPDWKKHQAIYSTALSKVRSYAPKNGSAQASRAYMAFMDEIEPHWQAQFLANQTRRRIQTIDADSQANLAMDSERWVKAYERGDIVDAQLAEWAVDDSLATRVKNGLMTEAQAQEAGDALRRKANEAKIWYGATGVMQASGIEEGIAYIEQTDLLQEDKRRLIQALMFEDNYRRLGDKQKAAATEEANEQSMWQLLADDNLTMGDISAAAMTADNKLKWRRVLNEVTEAKLADKESPLRYGSSEAYLKTHADIMQNPGSWNVAKLRDMVLKRGKNSLSIDQYETLVKLWEAQSAQKNPETKAAWDRAYQELHRLHLDGALFEGATYTKVGGYGFSAVENEPGFWGGGKTKTITRLGLKGDTDNEPDAMMQLAESGMYAEYMSAVDRYRIKNPDASPEEISKFVTDLTAAAKQSAIGQFLQTNYFMGNTISSPKSAAVPEDDDSPQWLELHGGSMSREEYQADYVRRVKKANPSKPKTGE